MNKTRHWIFLLGTTVLVSACGQKESQTISAPPSYQQTAQPIFQPAPALTPGQSIEIQSHLASLGYPVGADSVSFDGNTRKSIMAFERSIGMPPSGNYSTTVLAALRASSNERGTRPEAPVAAEPAPALYQTAQPVVQPTYEAAAPLEIPSIAQRRPAPPKGYPTASLSPEVPNVPADLIVPSPQATTIVQPPPVVTQTPVAAPAAASTPIIYTQLPPQPSFTPVQTVATSPSIAVTSQTTLEAPTAAVVTAPAPIKLPAQIKPTNANVASNAPRFDTNESDGGRGSAGGGAGDSGGSSGSDSGAGGGDSGGAGDSGGGGGGGGGGGWN